MRKHIAAVAVAVSVALPLLSACQDSGDAARPSASSASSGSGGGELTGAKRKVFLELLRNTKNEPGDVGEDELVAQGNAVCAARGGDGVGGAVGDTLKATRDTRKKLGISAREAAAVVGAAKAACKMQP